MKSDNKKTILQTNKVHLFLVVILTTLYLLLTLTGCNNIVENPGTGKPNLPEDGSGLVAVTGQISLSGAFPGTLQSSTGSQRTAIPTVGVVTYTVTAQNKADPGERVTAQVEDNFNYTLYLSPGNWVLSCSGVNESGSQIIREKSPIELTVTQGVATPQPGTLELFLSQTPGTGGTGAVSLNGAIDFVKDGSAATVTLDITLTPWDEVATASDNPDIPPQTIKGNGNFTVTLDTVPSGAYIMRLVFSVDGIAVSTVEEAVNVFDNMTTDTWYVGGGNSDHLTPQQDGSAVFNLTRCRTEFFINGIGGADTNSGSALNPLKTLGKAFSVLGKVKGADAKITLQSDAGDTEDVTVPEGVDAVIFGEQAATVSELISVGDGATVKVGTNVTCTGGAMVQSGGVLTLTQGGRIDGTGLSGIKNSSGGAVYIEGGTFTMESGSTVTGGNVSANGGAVYVDSGTFTMNGGSVAGGHARCGGAVYVSGGSFTMKSGSSITGSSAGYAGGGVYVGSNGSFTMNDGTISSNTVSCTGTDSRAAGGGVYNAGIFTMNNGNISGNSASQSGQGSEAQGGGVFVAANGNFTMGGGTIGGDDYNSPNANSAKQYGGGIFVADKGSFTMTGGAIKGNKAAGNASSQGGGVFVLSGGTFVMGSSGNNSGTVSGNYAQDQGGGVCLRDSNATFRMEAGTVTDNTSEAHGAGVAILSGGKFEIKGDSSVTNNKVNSGSFYGGGVYVDGTFSVSGTPSITNNTVSSNPNNVYLPSGKTITIGDGGLTGGTIGVTAADMKAGSAVQITDTDVTGAVRILISDDATYSVAEGVATSEGSGTAVFLSDAEVAYKSSSELGKTLGTFADAYGGKVTEITLLKDITSTTASGFSWPVVFDWTCTLDLNGHTINREQDREINEGQVIKIFSPGNLTIKDSSANADGTGGTGKITGGFNDGDQDNGGGGIYMEGGSLTLESGSITGNKTFKNGGGVYVGFGCTFTMKGGSITDNTADNDGGGVYVGSSCTFTMTGGFIGSTATPNKACMGGGIYIGNGDVTISGNAQIIGNQTKSYPLDSTTGAPRFNKGGGVYLSFGTLTMSGNSCISENMVDDLGGNNNTGGGVYIEGGTFTQGTGKVEKNTPNDVYPEP